ncbi:MAG TPA: DUF885 family protein, partial [Vicinamibacteria bacterium]|nr:DUF885 family protein [Vicinamibacteria bacterium]
MDPTRSLLALVLLSGKSMASPEPEGMSARFGALADAFVKEELALSPVGASDAGYHVHPGPEGKPRELDAELDDWSPEAVAGRRAFCRSWAERFRRETPPSSLGSQDTADFALISDQIALMELGLDKIERHRYDPTFYVELIGNGLFLPLTQGYAPKDVRVNHALLRLAAIPRLLAQAKKNLSDADPIFVKVAREENDGNISLVKETLLAEIPEGSSLRAAYDRAAPPAIGALQDFSRWLEEDLGKRRPSRTWRFGKDLYREQFRYVLNTDADPETVLAQAEA